MKKLMFALVAAGAAAVMGEEIASQNVVGFNTLGWMNQGTYYMMGMQFEKAGAVAGTPVKLSEIDFGDMTGPKYDSENAFRLTAPQIQLAFPDREGNTDYYYLADGAPNFIDPGWVDSFGNPVDPDVSAALGFWYRNTTSVAPSLTFAGQVMLDSPFEKTYNASFRMLVNPFPVATKLSDIDFGDIVSTAPVYDSANAFRSTATQIQVPFADREGFTDYYFLADGAENFQDPGWVDSFGNPVDEDAIVIPVGRGCWFKGNQALTLTFTK